MAKIKIKKTKQKRKLTQKIILIALVLLVFILFLVVQYFDELSSRLFEERSQHLMEFTDKVAEVIDGVGDRSWAQVDACKHILLQENIDTTWELMRRLKGTSEFIDGEKSVVLLMDEDGNYYASDGKTGYWLASATLIAGDTSRRLSVVELPHVSGVVYFLFMERLPQPVRIREEGKKITHIAMAVDINSLREQMSVSGFGDECYSYIVNEDGRRLYEYTYEKNFITGFNIINAIKEYPIVNGGSYDELYQVFENGENTALEFEYQDSETGERRNWFVANAAIQSTDWQVLLFVPTDVLGAHTNQMLRQTIYFFLILFVILLSMFGMMLLIISTACADKKLMKQQEKMNAELSVAVEEAQSANKAKSEFLSYMSHDIRTPINGIMGMTELAIKHIDDKERALDCLGKVQSSSSHLLNLVNDVLVMSRIEMNKTEIGHAPFDIRMCLANCASIIDGQLIDREVELVRMFEEVEHPWVIGDELHLRQILINILGNSVKFTPDGGKIYFRVREMQTEEGKAVFQMEVEDTGIGMKPEFLPHLFDPFAQEDGGSRTTYKGTGLGMAITKKFLDLLGGTVRVESTLNVGTKFMIELPMEIDYEGKKSGEKEQDCDIVLKGMKVLLVEDNELNMEIAKAILEEQEIIVTDAENGQIAVERFGSNPPGTFDVILMDIMMPVMDGLTATKVIREMEREDAKEIPILAMTANAYDEDIQKTQEAGMTAHLSKPIDVNLLLRTLKFYYTKREDKE